MDTNNKLVSKLKLKCSNVLISWVTVNAELSGCTLHVKEENGKSRKYFINPQSETFQVSLFSVTGKSNAFEISQVKKYPNEMTSITFCASSKEKRDQWIETIDNNIKQSLKIQNQVFSNIICFFKILKYLDIYDILQCARVSKSWFSLLFNNESKQIHKFWRAMAIKENYLGKHHKSNRYDGFYSTRFYRKFCLDMRFINEEASLNSLSTMVKLATKSKDYTDDMDMGDSTEEESSE